MGVPLYGGCAGSTGTIIRDSGLYTYTVIKSATCVYVINFNTAIASNQDAVSAVVRNGVAMLITCSSQTPTACAFCTFNKAGPAVDTQASFSTILTRSEQLFRFFFLPFRNNWGLSSKIFTIVL